MDQEREAVITLFTKIHGVGLQTAVQLYTQVIIVLTRVGMPYGGRALWWKDLMEEGSYGGRALWRKGLMEEEPYGGRALWGKG